MKVLFAVNNDNVSEAIVKKYQRDYQEILSYKNVYYFNAIYQELQKDKSYSRIVISEDLEPYANNDYDLIDKFLFEKYSKITEEIKNAPNEHIDIILICADRRKKTDDMLIKIYSKEIYNAIIGQDRSIDEICRLINHPRDKEAAKQYYNIHESELGETESEESVSEAEVENIIAHYARLGKNENKYIDSFNNIVSQYNDTQLRIIIKYLPLNVKAVLEERSPKYQQLVTTSALNGIDFKKKTENYKEKIKNKQQVNEENSILEQLIKPKNIKSVVIPTNITTSKVQKIEVPNIKKPEIRQDIVVEKDFLEQRSGTIETPEETDIENIDMKEIETDTQDKEKIELEAKRGRGRPRKNPPKEEQDQATKRGRGRPKKQQENEIETEDIKAPEPEIDLFNLDEQEDAKQENTRQEEIDLFSLEEETEQPEIDLFNMPEESNSPQDTQVKTNEMNIQHNTENNYIAKTNNTYSNLNTLLTSDKKIVAFVGTTKNGTSFVVNNTAEMLASMGINTAILDMTKTKNAYYIYTNNEETLRGIARDCMKNLQNGVAAGISAKRNLTVYTEMPGEEKEYEIDKILSTLATQYSAILIDTDFDTNPEIFEKSQEIYLVQSMDVLTIQPLTAFLRNLKSKDILKPEKLKIVINKSAKIRSLNAKTLIGGMSCYNSPNMTYMTELFNKDTIKYCEIPFEMQNYVKYLDSLANCVISLNGYTKQFITSLRELANMVYPLVNKQPYSTAFDEKRNRNPFSSQTNEILNRMKKNY